MAAPDVVDRPTRHPVAVHEPSHPVAGPLPQARPLWLEAEHDGDLAVEVAGSSVDVQSLMVATHVDDENEVVNITAWHEVFENVDDNGRFQILYLLLDE